MSLSCFTSKRLIIYQITGININIKNLTIHKCDLSNVCDTLEIHIELISIENGGLSRIEHYGKDFDEKYKLGLIKTHYFINEYTELTYYCLENYEEVNDLNYYITICSKHKKKVL